MSDYRNRAEKIIQRIDELAAFTETTGMLTRTYGTKPFVAAGNTIKGWMQEAGLQTTIDNIHNVRGTFNCNKHNAQTLLIASHFDSVVNAGKFDGPLGILMGLDVIEQLSTEKTVLPFHVDLFAFCDEEGVRFHTTFLGSKVIAGSFDKILLTKKDQDGVSLNEVIRTLGGNPDQLDEDALPAENLLGYFEMHIEQGPVLYESGTPVALVTAIAGQQRVALIFTGMAGHAGTVPMHMRGDALCGAADCILAIEKFAVNNKEQLVATVGKLDIPNAASNVIPGQVICTLDIRSADEKVLESACATLTKTMTDICAARHISFEWRTIQSTSPVACSSVMNGLLKKSIVATGHAIVELVSGAGHDAVPIAAICPVSMLFVRCFKGISHNPLEAVDIKDVAAALEVADNFLLHLITTFNKE